MQVRSALLISCLVAAVLLVWLIGVSRSISPLLVETEQKILVQLYPTIQTILEKKLSDDDLTRLSKATDVSIVIFDIAGNVEQSTQAGLSSGSRLNSQLKEGSVQTIRLNEVSLHALPVPARIGDSPKRVLLLMPNQILGIFLDEMLTIGVIAILIGIAGSIAVGIYLAHFEKALAQSVGASFQTLLSKKSEPVFSDKLKGEHFAPLKAALAKTAEDIKKTDDTANTSFQQTVKAKDGEIAALRAALSSMKEGVMIIDRLGRITAFNAAMEMLSGMHADQVADKVISDILTLTRTGKVDQLTGLISKIISTGVSEVFPSDTLLKKKGGDYIPVTVKTVPVKNNLKELTHVVIVIEGAEKYSPIEAVKEETPVIEMPVAARQTPLAEKPAAAALPAKPIEPTPTPAPTSPELPKSELEEEVARIQSTFGKALKPPANGTPTNLPV